MERHDLLHEFPEFQDKIRQLKTSDTHFKDLFDQYDDLEHKIHRINTGEDVIIDEAMHEMKAKLLFIKDEIFSLLQK
ncbi:MAG TPA: DUF465 domain-containing protein [Flavobacterium sp.]|uniref:YdcH family protein n=1 Tax=Flavobacterium sp. TaxID=239 RepID=UPI002C5DE20C|nr:DUF465 domain-containing protein [Flavobacterium sp.]HSD14192.1 DUF465 domain-containing protein [Flavobacterium sp.]